MSDNDPAIATREGGTTYHLSPEQVWTAQRSQEEYRPERFDDEGFIHCTDGEVNLLAVANRYYQDDRRPYLALEIDLDRVSAPVRYEDEDEVYPHIYGPLEREAVVGVRRLIRGADGSFIELS